MDGGPAAAWAGDILSPLAMPVRVLYGLTGR